MLLRVVSAVSLSLSLVPSAYAQPARNQIQYTDPGNYTVRAPGAYCREFAALNMRNPELVERRANVLATEPDKINRFPAPSNLNRAFFPNPSDKLLQILYPYAFVDIRRICVETSNIDPNANVIVVPVRFAVHWDKRFKAANDLNGSVEYIVRANLTIRKDPAGISVDNQSFAFSFNNQFSNVMAQFAPIIDAVSGLGRVNESGQINDPRGAQQVIGGEVPLDQQSNEAKALVFGAVVPVLIHEVFGSGPVWNELMGMLAAPQQAPPR